jgi:hypothetical protein
MPGENYRRNRAKQNPARSEPGGIDGSKPMPEIQRLLLNDAEELDRDR